MGKELAAKEAHFTKVLADTVTIYSINTSSLKILQFFSFPSNFIEIVHEFLSKS